ncbi:MAG TPA: hypothetical protein VF619_14365 [Allosphingosinicella sp.]|jgi:hypothetical protein
MKPIVLVPALLALIGCGQSAAPPGDGSAANKVVTSGKRDVPLAGVPPEVLTAATASQPGFVPAEAEAETRDGRDYFDIGGRLADGSEIEFDIVRQGAGWEVVETQRDIALAAAPQAVRSAAEGFAAIRVIESRQKDGLVIFELYDSKQRKLEIKWDGRSAERLTAEWAH